MARDRGQKPDISGGSVSSEDLLKDAWRSMGRSETGDRIEGDESPSAVLAGAATKGQTLRTQTAEEIAQMLLDESKRREERPRDAGPQPRRQTPPPQQAPTERPRRAAQTPPPPPLRPPPSPTQRQQPPTQRQQPQPQQRNRRGLVWVAFALFWLISSVVGIFFSDDGVDVPDIEITITTSTVDFSDLTSTTLSSTPEATAVNIRDVRVGQCIESLPIGSIVNDVAVVPCELPHQYELFANTVVDSADFPGDEVFELATEACIPLFATYVGEDYFDSLYYIDPIAPTEEGWRLGDRAVNCLLYSWPDGAEDVEYVTGSAEGTGNARS